LLFLTEFARGAFFFTFFPFWVVNHLKLSITVVGVAVSAHYLTETLFKTIAGWEFDRLGRPVLMGGLVLSLISLLLIKNWPAPMIMIGAAGLFGLGFSPLWLGVISKVAPVGIPNRATRIGLVFATWLAGAGSGMVSVNFIMARNYDTVFWLIIFLWVTALPIAWFSTTGTAPKDKTSGLQTYRIWNALKHMVSNKILVILLMPGMFLQTLAAGLLLPVLPIFVQQHLHLDHNQYGLLLLAGGATAVVSLLPMGYLADRLALKFLLTAGFGASSLLLVLFTYSRGIREAIYYTLLLGFSYAMVLPAWNSLLARIIPPQSQATGWGVFATVEGLGITFGPALGAYVAGKIGVSSSLVLTSSVLMVAAFFYLVCPIEKMLAGEQGEVP